MAYRAESAALPSSVEADEGRLHYCAVVDRAVLGPECRSQCNKESVNAEFCMGSKCAAPWRLCIMCLLHKTVVPASVVVNRDLGYCAFHERVGPSRRRINVFAPWENQPKEMRARLRKNASSEEVMRTILRLKARWEGLSIRELVEETGLSLAFVCGVFPRAKRQFERMRRAGILEPSLEEFVTWSGNPQPRTFVVEEGSDTYPSLVPGPISDTADYVHDQEERRLPMPKGKKLSRGEISKIQSLLKDGKKTRAEIAGQFGVAETTIKKYGHKKGSRKKVKEDVGRKRSSLAMPRLPEKRGASSSPKAQSQGTTARSERLESAWAKVQEGLAEIEVIYAEANAEAQMSLDYSRRALDKITKFGGRRKKK